MPTLVGQMGTTAEPKLRHVAAEMQSKANNFPQKNRLESCTYHAFDTQFTHIVRTRDARPSGPRRHSQQEFPRLEIRCSRVESSLPPARKFPAWKSPELGLAAVLRGSQRQGACAFREISLQNSLIAGKFKSESRKRWRYRARYRPEASGFSGLCGAVEKTRTSTAFRPQRPQRCASTSSATTAHRYRQAGRSPPW